MPDTSKEKLKQKPVSALRWLFGYLLPGLGLLVLGFVTAAMASADAIGLGGFLCFFVLGVSLMVEGTKRWLAAKTVLRGRESVNSQILD